MTEREAATLPERPGFLVLVFTAPAIWAAHFVVSYATASIWCARYAGPGGPLDPIRAVIVVYTVVALGAIAFVGWGGYRRHGYGSGTAPHDEDTPEDRHRFLGLATMLLAGLSGVATAFVAMSAMFFDTCR
jgi:hypothetical protein